MFQIRLCGQDFQIDNHYQYIKSLCRDYFSDSETAYPIFLSEADYAADTGDFSPEYREFIAVYRKISEHMIPQGCLPFHASALSIDGTAYLFTAPSGTGKSTHASLWRQRFGDKVTMLNDDKPMLTFEGSAVRAWGTPWCGKEGMQTNTSAPVGGIIVLHQAKKNEIRPLSGEQAFPLLLRQTWLPEDSALRLRVITMVDQLSRLRVYSMGCTISQDAVTMACETLCAALP